MSLFFSLKKIFYKITSAPFIKKRQNRSIVIKCESKNWVLNQLANEYKNCFLNFSNNISLDEKDIFLSKNIDLFIMSKYHAFENLKKYKNRVYFPYFHGIQGEKEIDFQSIKFIKNNLNNIERIQITNSLIENFFLENSIPKTKFRKIPITVDIKKFNNLNNFNSKDLRNKYNIPLDSFVIGSFQKDGNGWGEGVSPKLIKGPDIFIKTIKILKDLIPELFVLLSGPSRGYLKRELEKLNVKYKHIFFENYDDLIKLYKCIDVYLITSREEGGPRAIMESFASKIPLVTTNVGQAIDLVKSNFNGFKSEKVNEEFLADLVFSKIYNKVDNLDQILKNGYLTVEKNSYKSQISLWKSFFNF